jgi:hypothetical protein
MTQQQLVRYDAMCRAIDAAYKVDEVKDIRDKAIALELYSKQARNIENERCACEVRLRAERKAGQLSRALERSNPGKRKKDLVPIVGTKSKSLRDAGISKKQAEQWEKLADISDKQFEAALTDRTHMPTTNGIIRAAAKPKVIPVSKDALWLWGRLRDFERGQDMYKGEPMLTRNPADVLATMTPEMKDDVHRLAPRVAAWLNRIGKE